MVIDDSNRMCGLAGEVIATISERVRLAAPPARVTRPDGAVLPFSLELDRSVQPSRAQLADAVAIAVKERP